MSIKEIRRILSETDERIGSHRDFILALPDSAESVLPTCAAVIALELAYQTQASLLNQIVFLEAIQPKGESNDAGQAPGSSH